MKRTTHALTGMAIGAVLSEVSGSDWLQLVAIGAAAGLIPDIDVLLAPLSRRAHRSIWTHSLFASVLLSGIWFAVVLTALRGTGLPFAGDGAATASIATVFFASFAHAGEDSATIQGCRLLYPLTRRRFSGPFRYDDIVTNWLISIASLAVLLACVGFSA
jgi:membrane-bound metal-dependent hydrolase YbcI (DUF457 family)